MLLLPEMYASPYKACQGGVSIWISDELFSYCQNNESYVSFSLVFRASIFLFLIRWFWSLWGLQFSFKEPVYTFKLPKTKREREREKHVIDS